jgi:hypothetical protein
MIYTKQTLFDEIFRFRDLSENWDGYGGIPPVEGVVENTISLVEMLDERSYQYISDIYPNPHGTIGIIWERYLNMIGLEVGISNMSYYVKTEDIIFNDNKPIDLEQIDILENYINNVI